MAKIVKKYPTRNQQRGPVPIDRWPLYPTREERDLQPTGKWDVPKYEGLTRDSVQQFFQQLCEPGDDIPKSRVGDTLSVNVQDLEDNRFLVYLSGTYCQPPPSARFLNGTLIRQWHMSTSSYWNTLRVYHAGFRACATHQPGDPPPTLRIENGTCQYPGERDARFNGLPRSAHVEAFHMKLQDMRASTTRVTLQAVAYHAYMRSLCNSHDQSSMPHITSTVQLDENRLQLSLHYPTGPRSIMSCATMFFGEKGQMTVAFYTE